ncbi:uncharacterized protein LOC125163034 isoform X2 [Prionailurus viverrinus]|uniref:uncharacterized protein LOC125163034 isoform X2 n=1 Tax=Prionailurus viverrinus TaxID=61388 RepID=UPI001FF174DC|nr:uncharacterized protein LOC125163034 isoform X2 [Prionailurus viverrinus]
MPRPECSFRGAPTPASPVGTPPSNAAGSCGHRKARRPSWAGHLGDAAHEGRRCSRRSRKTTRGRLCQRPAPGAAETRVRHSQTLHARQEAASVLSPRTRKTDTRRTACWPHPRVDPGLPDSRPGGGPVAYGVFCASSSCRCSSPWWQQDSSWGIPAPSAPSLWEMQPEPWRFWSEGPSGGLSPESGNAQ